VNLNQRPTIVCSPAALIGAHRNARQFPCETCGAAVWLTFPTAAPHVRLICHDCKLLDDPDGTFLDLVHGRTSAYEYALDVLAKHACAGLMGVLGAGLVDEATIVRVGNECAGKADIEGVGLAMALLAMVRPDRLKVAALCAARNN
jgi:hypothetical protein